MPEQDDKKKRRPLKNIPPEGFQPKVLLIWGAIILAIVVLFLFNPAKAPQPASIKIQQVVELAEKNLIAEGTIRPDSSGGRDWSTVAGDAKDPMFRNDAGVQTKSFVASGRLTDANLERLQKSQAFVEKPATTVMTQLLLNILPFVLVIGLLYFLFVR